MAKGKLGLGVELVGEEIRLALVESLEGAENRLELKSVQTVRAGEDLSRALRSLPGRPAGVVCAVSLEHAAVRILSLPPTVEDNLERVVALEAETALPLGSEELALSHHVLGMTDLSRLEVLIAAARQSEVQGLLRRINCLPWVSAAVTVTPVALLNALAQLREAGRETACALLRMEDRESELVVLERGRILAAQSLPIGPGAAASRELAAASAGSGRGAPSEGPGEWPQEERPWMQELAQQLRYALQSLSYERGLTPERLYVCGRGAALPGALSELGDLLRMPVSPLLAPGGSTPEAAVYAVAYGCAIQAVGHAAVPLNLTPPRVTVAREEGQRRQTQFSWGALGGAAVLAGALVFGAAMHNRQMDLDRANARLRDLGDLGPGAGASPAAMQAAAKALEGALEGRVSADGTLTLLSRQLPVGTWLAELTYNPDTGCVVRGYSTTADGAQRAQIALLRQQLFDEVTLDYRTEERIGTVPVWGFQLSCKLHPKERTRAGGRR